MTKAEYLPVISSEIYSQNSLQNKKVFVGDLHLHTNWSDGLLSAEGVVDTAIRVGLNSIAITDHNCLHGADTAANYVSREGLPIELIRGVEVSSSDGHILALNVEASISTNLSLSETIRQIHRQQGLVIVPHPSSSQRNCVTFDKIQAVLDSDDPELYLDGIEVFNASEVRFSKFDFTQKLFKSTQADLVSFIKKNIHNDKLGALLSNSDSHTFTVAHGLNLYQKNTSILSAIRSKNTLPVRSSARIAFDLSEISLMIYAISTSHLIGSMSLFKNEK